MGTPVEVTDGNLESFVKENPVAVVDCWAPWCGPCRMIAPLIDELATEYAGRVAFGKLNTDENQATARGFRIMSIPTLLIFKGGENVDRIIGAVPKKSIEDRLTKLL